MNLVKGKEYEVVSMEESDRLAARERYTFYRDRGYPIKSHNLGS